MIRTFDATVDFDAPDALETELMRCMAEHNVPTVMEAHTTFGIVLRHDSEQGELYIGNEDMGAREGDIAVIGWDAADLAAALRAAI